MLAWSTQLNRPYESAWALLQRFRLLNQPSALELYRLLGKPGIGYSKFTARSNFVADRVFSEEKFRAVFGISSREYKMLFPQFYRLNIFNWPDESLRYCPKCMESGYHTALQQAPALRLCPIHETVILDHCSVCNEPIQFDLSRVARANLYACQNGHPLVSTDVVIPFLSPLEAQIIDRVGEFTKIATTIAADSRRFHWIFDRGLEWHADRRAYGLFAKATDRGEDFARLFFSGPLLKKASIGRPEPVLPANYVHLYDSESRFYEAAILRKARRWLRHIAYSIVPSINARYHPYFLRGLPTKSSRRVQGIRVKKSIMDSDDWMDFWTRDPGNDFDSLTSGALSSVVARTVSEHYSYLQPEPRSIFRYPMTERQYRWAYRKMLVWLFVATYKLAVVLNAWAKRFPPYPRRLPPRMGAWAYPRFYLLADATQLSIFIMEPDHTSPQYREAVINEPNRMVRAGGRRFLAYLDGNAPPHVRPKPNAYSG